MQSFLSFGCVWRYPRSQLEGPKSLTEIYQIEKSWFCLDVEKKWRQWTFFSTSKQLLCSIARHMILICQHFLLSVVREGNDYIALVGKYEYVI